MSIDILGVDILRPTPIEQAQGLSIVVHSQPVISHTGPSLERVALWSQMRRVFCCCCSSEKKPITVESQLAAVACQPPACDHEQFNCHADDGLHYIICTLTYSTAAIVIIIILCIHSTVECPCLLNHVVFCNVQCRHVNSISLCIDTSVYLHTYV